MAFRMSVFLDTLENRPTSRRPVWFMRQAGRYLPDYRRVRAEAGDFLSLCADAERSAEVTCQPVEILGVDAGIIFSDILTIPMSLGMDLELIEGTGPVFPKPLTGPDDCAGDRPEYLEQTYAAIRLASNRLGDTPLIGFCGSPWTLLAYMVEGRGSKTFSKAKTFLAERPAEAREILDRLTDSCIRHLKAQVAAGCQAVQIFDTWGGLLDPADFALFDRPDLERLAGALEGDGVPTTVFCKGVSDWGALANLPARCLGVDWSWNLGDVRTLVGPDKILQGNLDPASLCGPVGAMETKLRALIEAHGPEGRHIINLGHGVTPDARVETVRAFVTRAQQLSAEMMAGREA